MKYLCLLVQLLIALLWTVTREYVLSPRHQGIDSGFRVFYESLRKDGQQVADVSFWIRAVGLCRFHDSVDRCAGLRPVRERALQQKNCR